MLENKFVSNLLVAAIVGIALIICSLILFSGIKTIANKTDTVTVKGYAEKIVKSDFVSWTCMLNTKNTNRKLIFPENEAQKKVVFDYLTANNVKAEEITFSPLNIREIFEKDEKGMDTIRIAYYVGNLRITINTPNIDVVDILSRNILSLNEKGLELESYPPAYYVKDIEQYKLSLLKEATQTAYQRADEIVKASKMNLGLLKTAQQGVFQVTAENSVDVSGYGEYDTSVITKKISLVVTLEYGIRN